MPFHYSLCSRLLLGASLLAGTALRAGAQTVPADTTRLQYSEELATPPAIVAPLRVQREERSLWKLGLNNFLPGARSLGSNNYYTRYGVHLAYERKLGRPAFSVQGEVSPAITHFRLGSAGPLQQALSVRAQVAGRYYYNLERRLRQGRSTGNFSANYLTLAVGAGLGRNAHDTPFYFLTNPAGRLATFDAALLYGVQRRLGRYGFVDANVGATGLFLGAQGLTRLDLTGSLRVGLVLGAPPVTSPARLAPADEVATLQPRFYMGAEVGRYVYRTQYSEQNPYPNPEGTIITNPGETQITGGQQGYGQGYGSFSQDLACFPLPYFYVGYYATPRIAVQIGLQREAHFDRTSGTIFITPQQFFVVPNYVFYRRDVAVPVVVRYAITAAFLRRAQFEVIGGLVPEWSTAAFRQYLIVNRQVTDQETYSFQRNSFGIHATAGFAASYGFGRRRRVQATAEAVLNKDLRTVFSDGRESLQGGASVGLRYRFGYR